jgi:hypothetical protein
MAKMSVPKVARRLIIRQVLAFSPAFAQTNEHETVSEREAFSEPALEMPEKRLRRPTL